GLQQNRVHVHRRLNPTGLSLQRLRYADLPALARDKCIQCLFLPFKWCNPHTFSEENPAESGNDKGFPHIGAGPEHGKSVGLGSANDHRARMRRAERPRACQCWYGASPSITAVSITRPTSSPRIVWVPLYR